DIPAFQLNEPGPRIIPTPELPNRPSGAGSRPGTTPMLQLNWFAPAAWPGQTNVPRLSQRSADGSDSAPSPIRSGRCVPRFGAFVPEGSPPLIVGVRYGPDCRVTIDDTLHPPRMASAPRPIFAKKWRRRPTGKSYTSVVTERWRRVAYTSPRSARRS